MGGNRLAITFQNTPTPPAQIVPNGTYADDSGGTMIVAGLTAAFPGDGDAIGTFNANIATDTVSVTDSTCITVTIGDVTAFTITQCLYTGTTFSGMVNVDGYGPQSYSVTLQP